MTYSRESEPVNDFEVEELYLVLKAIPAGATVEVAHSTANIFHRVRLGIAEGEISRRQVVFFFEDEGILVNEYGAIAIWPKGFLEQAEYCTRILKTAMDRRRELREWGMSVAG